MWEKHTSDGGRHMWEKRLFFFLMLIIRLDNLRVRVYLPGGGGVRGGGGVSDSTSQIEKKNRLMYSECL